MNNQSFGYLVFFIACLLLMGCSGAGDRPDLGEVSGIVTLDGQPLAHASISFIQEGFRPSIGQTDDQGRYELTYIRDIKGAAVGTHMVKIKVFGPGAQKVPPRYNSESELTCEVKPGHNEINFDLTSNP